LSGYAILTCSHVLRNYSAGRKSVVITSRKTILNRFARQSTLRVSLHFFLKYFYNPWDMQLTLPKIPFVSSRPF